VKPGRTLEELQKEEQQLKAKEDEFREQLGETRMARGVAEDRGEPMDDLVKKEATIVKKMEAVDHFIKENHDAQLALKEAPQVAPPEQERDR
jgi:hypothetical protein